MENVNEGQVVEGQAPAAAPAVVKEPRVRNDMETFLGVLETAESKEDAAAQLDITLPSLEARMSNYRKQGIPIREFARKNSGGTVAKNALAVLAKLRGVSIEEIQAQAEALAAKRATAQTEAPAAPAEGEGVTAPAAETQETAPVSA